MMTSIVPTNKSDDEACQRLNAASDAEVLPHIAKLLQCLQDINWPIAWPVAQRLSSLGPELVKPICDVLSTTDEVWKYWIVSHLLHTVRRDVYQALLFKLNHMRRNPSKAEREEEVHDAVCELLNCRGRG